MLVGARLASPEVADRHDALLGVESVQTNEIDDDSKYRQWIDVQTNEVNVSE